MIYLADLDFGNLGSVVRFLDSLHIKFAQASVVDILDVSKGVVLLPGNGHWSSYLKDQRLNQYLKTLPDKVALMGICGGYQVMFESSEEGPENGLGICEGKVERLKSDIFPHVGPKNVSDGNNYYFLNCYGAPLVNLPGEVNTYKILDNDYMASWQCDKFAGFQFHPEVSGESGRKIFLRYLDNLYKEIYT